MSKGYWIIRLDVIASEPFGEYIKRTPEAITKYGGKFLARAGKHECVEGVARSRNSIIEFPSYQAAMDCWNSLEYQSARDFRLGAAEMDIVLVEGC